MTNGNPNLGKRYQNFQHRDRTSRSLPITRLDRVSPCGQRALTGVKLGIPPLASGEIEAIFLALPNGELLAVEL